MAKKVLYVGLNFVMLSIGACRQAYNSPANANLATGYLVADGFINSGTDSTIILLSRTRGLPAGPYPVSETDAIVLVEGDGGFSTALTETVKGKYVVNNLNLSGNQKYRLNITTKNGSRYVSDFTPLILSPSIDSISWKRDSSGVVIYANTHDPLNNTRYYRWNYVETWEYHAPYPSKYRWNASTKKVYHVDTETPHICWQTANSTNISLATSSKLAQDVIYQAPLNVIPGSSLKIGVRYSILVNQYAITSDAYNYWLNIKKTSEQAGSLFDQEPSQITGNLHCINNPSEPVLGYISTGTIARQRIFINSNQVQPWNYAPSCANVPTILDSVQIHVENDDWLPISPVLVGTTNPPDTVGYYMSSDYCVDCTLRFGIISATQIQPDFWQ